MACYDPKSSATENDIPFYVSETVIENNPKFAQLLRTLGKHLDPKTLASLEVHQEFQEAQDRMRIEKETYLRNYFIYQAHKNFLLYHAKSCRDHADPTIAQCYERVKAVVGHAELIDYCRYNENGAALLGITEDVIEKSEPPQLNFAEKEYLAKHTEDELSSQCKTVVDSYYLEDISDDDLMAKITQLPGRLDLDERKFEECIQDIRRLKKAYQWQLEQYGKTLLNAVNILQELIKNYRLCGPPEHNKRLAELMAIKVEAFTLKLRLVQMEVLNETYTHETTTGLKNIRSVVLAECKQIKQELTDASCGLQSYEILGDEFAVLVTEYKNLQEKIETNKWAIDKMENKS